MKNIFSIIAIISDEIGENRIFSKKKDGDGGKKVIKTVDSRQIEWEAARRRADFQMFKALPSIKIGVNQSIAMEAAEDCFNRFLPRKTR